MNAKDKLAELIIQAIDTYATMPLVNGCRPELKYFIADYLLANGVVVVDMNVVSPKNRPLISQCLGRPLDEIIELVHAKGEGRIIVTPCKVGDTVYRIVKRLNGEAKIVEGKVFEIALSYERHSGNEYQFYFWANGDEFTRRHYSTWCDFVDFGKTVFLSRELAEEALEAKQNDKE